MAEKSIKQYVFRKGAAKRIPVSGTFELTSRCNLNCKMCYIHMSQEEQCKRGKEFTTEEWIALGKTAVKQGMVYLLLTGGEPLLRPDFLEIYTSMVKMGVLVSVNTNGTLITEEIIECFQKYRPENVNITLYGMSDRTYGSLCGNKNGFEKAMRGILMLKEAGIRVTINTTFTLLNAMDMEHLISFAKSENIPIRMAAFTFPPVRNRHEKERGVFLSAEEQGRLGAEFDKLTLSKEQLGKRRKYIKEIIENDGGSKIEIERLVCEASSCMAGRGAFWVSWDGQMYPCGMLPEYYVNLREVDFASAWQQIVEQTRAILVPTECTQCKYKKICPSCAAVGQSINGATNKLPKEICRRTEAYVEEILE